MKKWFLILISMMMAIPMTAQIGSESRFRPERKPIGVGVKVGALLPYYHYRARGTMSENLNELPFDTAFFHRVRPVVGVQAEIPMGNLAYFAPELIWAKRGDNRLYLNAPTNDSVHYVAKVNYLDLRLPIEFVIPIKGRVQPYLFGGLDVGVVMPYFKINTLFGKALEKPVELNMSGTIMQTQGADTVSVMVNKGNMNPFDFGVFGGAGIRYTMEFDRFSLVVKLEALYSMGLRNTYSKGEMHSQTPAENLGNEGTHYSVGYRFNRGWECNLSVVLPLRFKPRDACSSFEVRRR